MQPLTSLVTQHRGCAVKMGVPATLQPDGALRRPAHTGPSLAKPPEGAQSPNCTCPPGWVQKKKHTREEGKKRQSSGQARPPPRQATSSPSVISHSHHYPQKLSTLRNHSTQEEVQHRRRSGEDNTENSGGIFGSEERFRHMHIQVQRALQTEPDDIYLGADHIPLQKQTLICCYSVGRKRFSGSSSNRQRVPEKPDKEEMQQKHQDLLFATVQVNLHWTKTGAQTAAISYCAGTEGRHPQ